MYFNPETAKKGCLYGPLRKIGMSLESQMVGFPFVIDMTQIKQTEIKGNDTTIPIINAETLKLKK